MERHAKYSLNNLERIGTDRPVENHADGFLGLIDTITGGAVTKLQGTGSTIQGVQDAVANANKTIAYVNDHWIRIALMLFCAIIVADLIAHKIVK